MDDNRSLTAFALLSANPFKKCPNLVWMTPVSVDKDDRNTLLKWIREEGLQKYSVVFICAHSYEPGHRIKSTLLLPEGCHYHLIRLVFLL